GGGGGGGGGAEEAGGGSAPVPPLAPKGRGGGHKRGTPPRESGHERPRHVTEADQPHRKDEGQHRPQSAEVSEADLQDLGRQPIGVVEDQRDGLGRASAVTRLAHGAGRCNLVELEAPRLLEAQGELRDAVGQGDDGVALPQVKGEERRHANVVEAEGGVVTAAKEELAQPRGLVGADQPVRLELEDHEAITLAELRAPRNADETTRGKTAREVALPFEAHEWRAPSHGLGGEA